MNECKINQPGHSRVRPRPPLTHLLARPPSQTVRVELVGVEHVDRTFDTEMMQLAGDL